MNIYQAAMRRCGNLDQVVATNVELHLMTLLLQALAEHDSSNTITAYTSPCKRVLDKLATYSKGPGQAKVAELFGSQADTITPTGA